MLSPCIACRVAARGRLSCARASRSNPTCISCASATASATSSSREARVNLTTASATIAPASCGWTCRRLRQCPRIPCSNTRACLRRPTGTSPHGRGPRGSGPTRSRAATGGPWPHSRASATPCTPSWRTSRGRRLSARPRPRRLPRAAAYARISRTSWRARCAAPACRPATSAAWQWARASRTHGCRRTSTACGTGTIPRATSGSTRRTCPSRSGAIGPIALSSAAASGAWSTRRRPCS